LKKKSTCARNFLPIQNRPIPNRLILFALTSSIRRSNTFFTCDLCKRENRVKLQKSQVLSSTGDFCSLTRFSVVQRSHMKNILLCLIELVKANKMSLLSMGLFWIGKKFLAQVLFFFKSTRPSSAIVWKSALSSPSLDPTTA